MNEVGDNRGESNREDDGPRTALGRRGVRRVGGKCALRARGPRGLCGRAGAKVPATASSADPAQAVPAKATADPAQAGTSDLPDHHRLPLVKAASSAVAPASFTISGMKYLEGRPLAAGEFSFRLGEGGAA